MSFFLSPAFICGDAGEQNKKSRETFVGTKSGTHLWTRARNSVCAGTPQSKCTKARLLDTANLHRAVLLLLDLLARLLHLLLDAVLRKGDKTTDSAQSREHECRLSSSALPPAARPASPPLPNSVLAPTAADAGSSPRPETCELVRRACSSCCGSRPVDSPGAANHEQLPRPSRDSAMMESADTPEAAVDSWSPPKLPDLPQPFSHANALLPSSALAAVTMSRLGGLTLIWR